MDRDPIQLVRGRVESMAEFRHGRMLEPPFKFFRGNALLQAHDLSCTREHGAFADLWRLSLDEYRWVRHA